MMASDKILPQYGYLGYTGLRRRAVSEMFPERLVGGLHLAVVMPGLDDSPGIFMPAREYCLYHGDTIEQGTPQHDRV